MDEKLTPQELAIVLTALDFHVERLEEHIALYAANGNDVMANATRETSTNAVSAMRKLGAFVPGRGGR